MDNCNNDTSSSQKAKLSDSKQKELRKLGLLRNDFSEEEFAVFDRTLLESMSEEELALWYDAPIMQASE